MTQELIANMLDVCREDVTKAADRLQREGIINGAVVDKHKCQAY